MALIHILDRQSDKIIGTLNLGEYTDDEKVTSSENENTFDFTTLKKFDLLQKRNRLLLQDVDGFFSEYIIIYAEQNSRNQKFIKSNATFTDLQKAKIIEPQILQGATADTATTKALEGTEWRKGRVDYKGIRTLIIEEYTNPYSLLKSIASEFGLDLRFRVAVEGNKIVRYVDLTLPDDEFDGKEVVFGKDLIGLRRIEDAQNIVTALLVLGPEQEDGKRPTVLVENNSALQRWGRNGQHLIEVYEPQITSEEVTVERLRTLGQNELQKRIDAIVTYECQTAILEHIPGKEHEKVRLDMTIRIKDDGYTPPLYIEAKVLEVREQPSTGKILAFKLGNYKEFSKADLEAQIAGLKKLLAQKASNAKLVETYELALKQAEEKAAQAENNSKVYTDTVKVQVVEHANTVANKAENNAKEHAVKVAGEAESKAKAYALSEADKAKIAAIQAAATDAQTKVNAAKTTLEASIAEKANAEWVNGQLVKKVDAEWVNGQLAKKLDVNIYNTKVKQLTDDIAKKAGLEYVNGQLVSKADKNNTYTKTEVDNALNSRVSNTTYKADKDGIVTELENHESRIVQTEKGLLSKVESATYEQKVSELETKVDNIRVGGENLLRNSNDFTNLDKFSGAQYSYKTSVAVSEWNATDATEIHVTGGDSAVKLTKPIVRPSVDGQEYTLSVWLKNIGEYPVMITANIPSKEETVNPGESKRVIINGKGNGKNNFQLNIKTSKENIDKSLDFIIWRCQGERGNVATDWAPAIEDTENKITAVETRMTTAETNIQQTASDIALKANKTDVYTKTETDSKITTVNNRIATAEASIKTNADAIALRAVKTDVYTKTETNNALANKADNKTVKAIETRVSEAESQLTVQAGQIASKVSQTEYNSAMASKENTVYKQNTAPAHSNGRLWLDTSVTPNVLKRSTGTAWVKVTPTTASEVGAFSQSDGNTLAGRISTAETSITQQASQIALKANQSTVDTLTGRVNSAESQLTVQAGQIASKVDKTSYDTDKKGIITRLNSAESRITQTEKDITSKVSQTTYDTKVTELTKSLSQKETPAGAQAKADAAKNAAISYADTKVDNIQVGGRNLASKNNIGKWSSGWIEDNYIYTITGPDAGLYIKADVFKTGERYVLTFKTKKISGTVTSLAGHCTNYTIHQVVRDGVLQSTNWSGGLDANPYPDDEEVHDYEIHFTANDLSSGTNGFYVQPNRSHYGLNYVMKIWDLMLEKGNKATDWTPAPEDVEAKITAVETRMSAAETGIQQTASAIELKANKTDVYTKTEVNNTLANKADNNRVATVESRVTTAEASIKTQADAIALRALKTDVYTKTEADGKISTAVNNAKADIKITTDSISQSVSSLQSTVSGQGTRLNSAESSIKSLSTQIQSKVSQTTFESALSGKENTVYKQNTAPAHANGRFWLDTSKTPNVLYRSNGSAWIKVTPTLAGEVGAFSQADGNSLAGRMSKAESTITQQAGLISSKAESSTVTALGTRVTTAEQNINGLTGEINQRVKTTDYNGNTISSLINQTATTIKLQAAKIALDGYVEAKHIKSLNGLNVGNGQFVVDANGNVKFAGNLEGASGTFGEVTVKDGDFYLKDTKSGIRYSLVKKTNILGDHSFELIKLSDPTSQDNIDRWWLPIITDNTNWETIGAPRGVPMSIAGPGPADAMPIFGNRAILVNSTNYIEQPVWDVTANTKYTFSVHAKRPYNNTPGAVRIEVHYKKYNADGTSTRQLVAAQSFDTVASDYSVSRHALTFTSPNVARTGSDEIIFVIKGVNANWVHVDGVQVVKSTYPTVYDTEDSLWSFMNSRNGFKARAIWTEGIYNGVNGIDIDHNRIRIYSNASLNYFSVENIESRFSTVPYNQWKDPEPNVKKAIKVNGGIATDGLYANAGSVSNNAIATNGKIYVGGEGIELSWVGGAPYIDFIRRSGVDFDMRLILETDSGLAIRSSDNIVRHKFYANGTKSGGTIEIDGKNLGMSPIDSPQILLETIEFDVPLTETGTKVLLDTRFSKAVNYRFAVFPNRGEVIEKGADYFIIAGTGTADIRIVGERVGYEGVYFDDMEVL